jgi:hypothetical protein
MQRKARAVFQSWQEQLKVIAGIDTHADTHHVGIITETGWHPPTTSKSKPGTKARTSAPNSGSPGRLCTGTCRRRGNCVPTTKSSFPDKEAAGARDE